MYKKKLFKMWKQNFSKFPRIVKFSNNLSTLNSFLFQNYSPSNNVFRIELTRPQIILLTVPFPFPLIEKQTW